MATMLKLASIWDALLQVLPELRTPPPQMRIHNPNSTEPDGENKDHALFWPIGQYVLADISRELLDDLSTQLGRDSLIPEAGGGGFGVSSPCGVVAA